ncbi:putative cobalt transporter CbtA [Actinoplanes octamycinicus]|uniref:Putative cobalt transporter CbtA n=1 Tax=Actinoplanes octamycinicus TaxID=135948 RepID=A0A7W7H2A5_9ACTN|nr:CbtA family protein [Actinoplanes octamycinicus]MBB4742644.1 putative cobalt transporter CbtA [Actinoplanes octamycinicus]GIE60982.1 membrane protein [Actinoplanes octamycinicus]
MPLKLSFGRLLTAGLLAGLIAGLLAGGFAYLTGEPRIDAAIAIEEQNTLAHGAAGGGEELVSRETQKNIGLTLATTLYGIALGGFLATAYALLRRRLHTSSDTRAALGLATAALTGIVLIPWLKYPPNPPAVGDPATIRQRTISYLALLALGLVAIWAGVLAARTQTQEWRRATAGTLAFLIVVTIAYTLLPATNEVPDTFPADLLWQFRLASLGTQVVLFSALGLAFAGLLHRLATSKPATVDA